MSAVRSIARPIKRALRVLGYDIKRLPSHVWLRQMGVRTVLDVGANTGQFAKVAREIFPEAMIYSFEPIGDCYRDLVRHFQNDTRFRAFQVALGASSGSAQFHRSSYSPSSSLRQMLDLHKRYFPYSAGSSTMSVQIERLDDMRDRMVLDRPILLKLDVQGYEDQVVAGGTEVLKIASIVIVEVSFQPLYADQPSFEHLQELFKAAGLRYQGNWDQLVGNDGRVLQADAIFMRQDARV